MNIKQIRYSIRCTYTLLFNRWLRSSRMQIHNASLSSCSVVQFLIKFNNSAVTQHTRISYQALKTISLVVEHDGSEVCECDYHQSCPAFLQDTVNDGNRTMHITTLRTNHRDIIFYRSYYIL